VNLKYLVALTLGSFGFVSSLKLRQKKDTEKERVKNNKSKSLQKKRGGGGGKRGPGAKIFPFPTKRKSGGFKFPPPVGAF